MFAKFNFKPTKYEMDILYLFEYSTKHSKCVWEHYKMNKTIETGIKKYLSLSLDGTLDAFAMEKDWFPDINAHVFISHSHQDEELANQLALWLNKKYGIKSFVDSAVWHYADNLLKQIDIKYCRKRRANGDFVYDYNKRNRSTAHVHMILQGAIAKMIDKCECFIFINTDNSINISDGKTASPWIYSELLMAKMMQLREPERYNELFNEAKLAHYKHTSPVPIKYCLNLDYLRPLNLSDIISAGKRVETKTPWKILDQLYKIKGIAND